MFSPLLSQSNVKPAILHHLNKEKQLNDQRCSTDHVLKTEKLGKHLQLQSLVFPDNFLKFPVLFSILQNTSGWLLLHNQNTIL